MTLPRFTPDGIQVQTFQEIYDELAAGYRVCKSCIVKTSVY